MIGIVLPVWLNDVPALWDSTRRAVASWAPSLAGLPATAYVVPQRLHTNDTDGLQRLLQSLTGIPVAVLPTDGARSVAGAWNAGIRAAQADNCDRYLVTANDCYWHPESIAKLDAYGRDPANADVLVWTGSTPELAPHEPADGCDFTGAMLRPETLARAGWFDAHYKPAYFEDNDYYVRVVLAGGHCRHVPGVLFDHAGSLTKRCDAESAHHVNYWFRQNHLRFLRKWGLHSPPCSRADVGHAHPTPWNDPALTVRDWDRE